MQSERHRPLLRFGIITDIHFSLEKSVAAKEELRRCLDAWHRRDVDLLLQLGDVVNGEKSAEGEDELREVNAVLKEFRGKIRHVIGNHCLAVPRQTLLAALALQAPFYAFSVAGFRFVALDGMDVSVLRQPETAADVELLNHFHAHPELHDYCGAVGAQQKAWLKRELEAAELAGERVMMLSHFPLLPETTNERYGLLWNHQEIMALLGASPAVTLCLSGHYHHGGYALHRGMYAVVLPAFVNRHDHPDFSCGTVELFPNKMVLRNQHGDVFLDLPLR
jgi:manganese-dependent ADP-ribose/CDP-alcohol diphosphatase